MKNMSEMETIDYSIEKDPEEVLREAERLTIELFEEKKELHYDDNASIMDLNVREFISNNSKFDEDIFITHNGVSHRVSHNSLWGDYYRMCSIQQVDFDVPDYSESDDLRVSFKSWDTGEHDVKFLTREEGEIVMKAINKSPSEKKETPEIDLSSFDNLISSLMSLNYSPFTIIEIICTICGVKEGFMGWVHKDSKLEKQMIKMCEGLELPYKMIEENSKINNFLFTTDEKRLDIVDSEYCDKSMGEFLGIPEDFAEWFVDSDGSSIQTYEKVYHMVEDDMLSRKEAMILCVFCGIAVPSEEDAIYRALDTARLYKDVCNEIFNNLSSDESTERYYSYMWQPFSNNIFYRSHY